MASGRGTPALSAAQKKNATVFPASVRCYMWLGYAKEYKECGVQVFYAPCDLTIRFYNTAVL